MRQCEQVYKWYLENIFQIFLYWKKLDVPIFLQWHWTCTRAKGQDIFSGQKQHLCEGSNHFWIEDLAYRQELCNFWKLPITCKNDLGLRSWYTLISQAFYTRQNCAKYAFLRPVTLNLPNWHWIKIITHPRVKSNLWLAGTFNVSPNKDIDWTRIQHLSF